MVVQAAIPVVTTEGEFAAPYLLRKAGEIGLTRFIQVYGSAAATAIGLQKTQPVDLQTEKILGMPVSHITGQGEVYDDIDYSAIDEDREVEPLKYIDTVHGGKGPLEPIKAKGFPAETEVKKWNESFKAPEKIETTEGLEVPPQEKIVPPGIQKAEPLGTDILTKDIPKQTEELVPKIKNKITTWEDHFPTIEEATKAAKDVGGTLGEFEEGVIQKKITFKKVGKSFDVYFDKKLIAELIDVTDLRKESNDQYKNMNAYNLVLLESSGVIDDFVESFDGMAYAKEQTKNLIANSLLDKTKSEEGWSTLRERFQEAEYNKKGQPLTEWERTKDIIKQTKDLVKKEPEFGALTEVEKQTALLEKGDKPDYYSRVVKAISEAEGDKNVIKTKNDWLGYINAQGVKKAEMDYLGLTEFLKGKDQITKQKLLEYAKEKDLSSRITTTLIPKKDMNEIKYPEYSLTGRYDTKVYVMQYDITKDKKGRYLEHDEPIEYHAPAIHVGKEQYGRNTFGTIRVEEGYTLDPDLKNITKIDKQNIEALKKTSIGAEFQSDMIQKGQKEGFKKAWKIYKGDEITKEFIETNYKDRYRLTENVTEVDKLNKNTSVLHTKELDRSGNETGKWIPIKRLIKDQYYVFDKTGLVLGQNLITKSKEEAEEAIKNYAPPEFPIKDSRKIAELMLTELINQAILAGNDSIAISNGQILVDRYYQADDKTKEGFKFWHDKILLGELRKIDKKILNETGINESLITEHILGTTVKAKKDDYMANFLEGTSDWVSEATEQGYSLKKMTKEELKTFLNLGSSIRMHTTKNNQTIPDHASIVTNVGNAQGIDNMRGYIEEPEMMTEYDDDLYSENFYIWMDANGKVKFELPIVSADDADIYMTDETRDTETSAYVEGLSEDFTERTYLEYIISNRQKIEDEAVDLKRPREKHKLFKLKLPKKYQKKFISESQKFTELKSPIDKQTQRLFT